MRKNLYLALLTTFLIGKCAVAVADSGGERITVKVQGSGPDVVLIPGLASSSAVWDATATHLEKHYRLHVVQVAGFAGAPSGANTKGLVMQPTLNAIDSYIRTNHLKSPKVIGHSMGGLMGMMLAIQHPADVSKLMVVDALPFFGVLLGAKDVSAAAPQAASMRDMILNVPQEVYVQGQEEFLKMLVKSPAGLKLAMKWSAASDKSVVARAMYEDTTTDIRSKLSQIKIPVTVLYAWDQAIGFPQATADGIYQENYASLPKKKLVRINDSLHFIMLDQPAKFLTQVDEFLK